MRSARASSNAFPCVRFLSAFVLTKYSKKTLYFGSELICEFFKQCLTITKTRFWSFLVVSASLQKFLRENSDVAQIAHLHSAARALSIFKCQQILTKISFVIILCWDTAKKLLTSCVFLQHREILHCESKIDNESYHLTNNIEVVIRVDFVASLIISAVFLYFQLSFKVPLRRNFSNSLFLHFVNL